MTELAALFDRVVSASARGDASAAYEAFQRAIGLRPRQAPAAIPTALPERVIGMLRYFGTRSIDRLALVDGARPVAKFEDLSPARAAALEADLGRHGLRTVRVGPYEKRFDVAVATNTAGGRLWDVIASRGDEAARVAEAERERTPEGARRAGLALGYPRCCVERFSELQSSALARRDGVNEAAIRLPFGQGRDAPWELNILSSMSPIGFVPCSVTCTEALAFARRVLGAVERLEPDALPVVRKVLSRPVLFFRYSIFFVLEGEATARAGKRAVRYSVALPNDDGTGLPAPIAAWQQAELGSALARGDEVLLGGGGLEIRRGEELVAEWHVDDPVVPMLLRFVGC